MVQADNGPEYGRYFEQQMTKANIQTRHSRLHRPNDNAHIERFNRTVQTECIGHYWRKSLPLSRQQARLTAWLAYYNNERIHLGIQMRTPMAMLQRSWVLYVICVGNYPLEASTLKQPLSKLLIFAKCFL